MNINLTKSGADKDSKRGLYYTLIKEQLDLLYHDIDSGKFGADAKTGGFYLGRKAVKDKYSS
jgi:hypothetical protein|tara:strand:+ start:619 stop:804 length:186 start_codon:yes stop_codon:yes gene_type:complete